MSGKHDFRPHCVVCGTQLPAMTRAEALEKGVLYVHDGKNYYVCAGGRHSEQEIRAMIAAVPKFERAGGMR